MVRQSRSTKVSELQRVSSLAPAPCRPEAISTLDGSKFEIRSNGTTGVDRAEQPLRRRSHLAEAGRQAKPTFQRGLLAEAGIQCSNMRQTATGATFAPNEEMVIGRQLGTRRKSHRATRK